MRKRAVLNVHAACLGRAIVVYQTQGGCLTAAGGERFCLAMIKDAPQQWTDAVSNHEIEDLTCVLGFHDGHVNLSWMLDSMMQRSGCNFVKNDALCRLDGERQDLANVPRNGFSLAIVVRGQENVLK